MHINYDDFFKELGNMSSLWGLLLKLINELKKFENLYMYSTEFLF